ncbi:MAG: hypothetical protein QOE98_2445 [Gaiellaceae bacterium]|nr:hypothetical protein [Gaiellaceae bacterium]
MPRYEIRDADTYGHAIGILLLDYRGPFIPGDVGNATTYDYPVLYKLVKGLTLDRVLAGDETCAEPIIEAAKELEQFGVRGISSDCGFLIQYQAAVQSAVKVPVFMSSMLQIPFVAQAVGGGTVGCLTASGERLTEWVLGLAGVAPGTKLAIRGMETEPHFKEAILEECGYLDSDRIEEECVGAARQLQAEVPDLAALVLECSLMPPYARAIQDATGLPVFDFVTMIDYYYAGTHRRAYQGSY